MPKDKTEVFDDMFDLLTNFTSEFREVIENDEPMNGCDAVDSLIDLYYKAKKALDIENG